jgi:hypothetical protein
LALINKGHSFTVTYSQVAPPTGPLFGQHGPLRVTHIAHPSR